MAAVLLILSFASAGMTLLWRRAENQRQRADELLVLSEKRRAEAVNSEAKAERNRAEAEAHFTKARAAVDELLTRVSESQLLNVPGLQPLRRDLLLSALAYYEDFVRERANDPTLKAGLATAELQLGLIQRELGAGDQSEQALRRAMGLLESALRDRPDEPRLRAGMARCCANLGRLGLEPGPHQLPAGEALSLLERAVGLWEGLSRAEPSNVDYASELAGAYNLAAILHSNNKRMSESLRALQASIAIRERRGGGASRRSVGRGRPGLEPQQSRRPAPAEKPGGPRPAPGLPTRGPSWPDRVRAAPQVVKYGRFLSVTMRNIMVTEAVLGHFDEARRAIVEALEVSRRLARDNPALPGVRREMVQDYHSLGNFLRERGRTAEAIRLYRESWIAAESMTRATADDWLAAAGLLGLCARPAVDGGGSPSESELAWCRRFGDAALAALRRAIAAGFKDAERLRVDDEFAVLRAREDFPAIVARAEAAARGETPTEEFARTPFPPPSLAAARNLLVAAFQRDDRPPGGPPGDGADAADGHPGAGSAADRTALEEEQASTQHAFGLVQLELGQFKEARASLLRALAIRESLAQSRPDEVRHIVDLSATRAAIGRLEWRVGRPADAIRAWDETRQGLESALPGASQRSGDRPATRGTRDDRLLLARGSRPLGGRNRGPRARPEGWFTRPPHRALPRQLDGRERRSRRIGGPVRTYARGIRRCHRRPVRQRAGRLLRTGAGCAPEPARLVEMAGRAVLAGHTGAQERFHLALANYRAGRFDEAVRQAEQSLAAVRDGEPGLYGPLDETVLAMALHRLGRGDDAARRLDSINRLGWDTLEKRTEPQDWSSCADFLTLRREAVETITDKPAPDDPELRRRRGRAYALLGQAAKAEAEFRAADAAGRERSHRSK